MNTFSQQLTAQQMNDLTTLCLNTSHINSTTTSTSTATSTTTTRTITTETTSTTASMTTSTATTTSRCQSFSQAYMSLTFVFSITSNENAEFYNLSSMTEQFNTTLNGVLQAYFLQSFLKFNTLMLSKEPIIISTTNNR